MTSVTTSLDEDDIDTLAPGPAPDFSYGLAPGVDVALERHGPHLLVCFGADDPFAHLIEDMDWSILRITADVPEKFHSDQVVGFFDAMLDSTLLDEFDSVLFLGSETSAAAALGYSICAPMARVAVFAPKGQLPRDGRYLPDVANLAVAESVQVFFDPRIPEQSVAAQEIAARGADLLPVRFGTSGHLLEDLDDLGALEELLEEAMDGTLTRRGFFQSLRSRRRNNGYLRALTARLSDDERDLLRALVLRHIGTKLGRKRYTQQFEKLEHELAARGVTVPPARS